MVDLLRCLSRRDVVGQRGKAKNGQEAEGFETFETLFLCLGFASFACRRLHLCKREIQTS
jgi:hypothetical protein